MCGGGRRNRTFNFVIEVEGSVLEGVLSSMLMYMSQGVICAVFDEWLEF